MTCPYYISGAERRKPVSVDDVCSSWKLDYNMGKVLGHGLCGDGRGHALLVRSGAEAGDVERHRSTSSDVVFIGFSSGPRWSGVLPFGVNVEVVGPPNPSQWVLFKHYIFQQSVHAWGCP